MMRWFQTTEKRQHVKGSTLDSDPLLLLCTPNVEFFPKFTQLAV